MIAEIPEGSNDGIAYSIENELFENRSENGFKLIWTPQVIDLTVNWCGPEDQTEVTFEIDYPTIYKQLDEKYIPDTIARTANMISKEYVDQGDTSLKEYLDEPISLPIKKPNESNYFTNIKDSWDDGYDEDFKQGAYILNDISSYNPNIEVTLINDLKLTIRCDVASWQEGNATFSIINNGETVFTETKPEGSNFSFSEFELIAKAGDTIKFNLTLTNYSTSSLFLSEEKEYKEYYPKDFAMEAIKNKIFTTSGDLSPLNPPAGYENFFEEVEPYDGFSCFVKITSDISDSGRVNFYIYSWEEYLGTNNFRSANKTYGKAGDIFLFLLQNKKWFVINLTATLEDDFKNIEVIKSGETIVDENNYYTIYALGEGRKYDVDTYFEKYINFIFVP